MHFNYHGWRIEPQLVDPAAKDRLEHDSSDLVNDLTQLWIFNSLALLDGIIGWEGPVWRK